MQRYASIQAPFDEALGAPRSLPRPVSQVSICLCPEECGRYGGGGGSMLGGMQGGGY